MSEAGSYELHEGGGLAGLFQRFEREYGDSYARLATELKGSYPDLTRPGRRTRRALRNICCFIWSYTRDGDEHVIPALFKASVLLSAQDDYYDNARIPIASKKSFCLAANAFIDTGTPPSMSEPSQQVGELMVLWSDVARAIRPASPAVHSYWKAKACRLNTAMEVENRLFRSGTATFDRYMHNAVHSIGMAFIWSTYIAHRTVPLSKTRAVDRVILRGARIARLSNDMASFRQGKKMNAVTLLGGDKNAEGRVRQLIEQESRVFREQLLALHVGADIERVMLRSVEFLKEFYQRSDFDERTFR